MRLLTVILFLICSTGFAQLSKEKYMLEYKKGVQLFANSQFDEALVIFTPLTSRSYSYSITPYAFFYHGLCSKKINLHYQTRVVYRQLIERFPDWEKIDEVFLAYAESNFIERYFDEGFLALERIVDPNFKSNINGLQLKYIKDINSVELLKDLYYKHPSQQALAEKLVKSIQEKKYPSKDELRISDELTNRFKLLSKKDSKKLESVKSNSNHSNKSIDIGILLPFNLTKSSNINNLINVRYIYDMYYGMQMAVEKLASEKIYVNLLSFDVEKNENQYKNIEGNSEFKNLDMIIGPLYPNINKFTSEFVAKNNLVQVHPLSNNQNLTKTSDMVFLGQASFGSQALKALEFVEEKGFSKTVSIYFGKNNKDSLMALNYKDFALKKGYKVLDYTSFKGLNSIKKISNPGHIFISCESTLTNKILNSLNQKEINAPMISTMSSFENNLTSNEAIKNELFLINLEYIDKEKESVKKFISEYRAKMNTLPSYYSFYGHDLILFYSRMLKDTKSVFKLNLNIHDFSNDYLGLGFDYTNDKKDNQLVPLVKYSDGRFIEVFR
jgi:ABC-type branched-subunit amino acid transport system substrate-binding protein